MKHMGDMLTTPGEFSEIVMGNTALVRGMLEAGIRVVASYPGSPTPEIAAAIGSIPKDKRRFYFEFSTNEKTALEVAFGASVNGRPAAAFFKSVGLNVAADTFVQLGHLNLIGGLVIVLGDDPGANSSQNEQDNRYYAQLAHIPVLEPASPTEVYSFFLEAARLSRERAMPIILRLTTHVCHAKEKAAFGRLPDPAPEDAPRFSVDNGPYIPIAARVFPMKRQALKRLADFREYAEKSFLNRVIDHGRPEQGIITMGLPFLSVMDVLEQAKSKPDVLKLGVVYPPPKDLIVRFLKDHAEVKILEELGDILEKEIKAWAYEEKLSCRIIGKTENEDFIGEYTPDRVFDLLRKTWPDLIPEREPRPFAVPEVPVRPAQLCPGCGHRSAFFAVKKALAETDITVADIGCHTLGFQPPYNMGQLLLCMGASTGVASGLSLFNRTRRVVAFLGDSTFFHAGLPGIINAVFNKHRLTLIIMENGTTAMTGHQDHAATGRNFNEPTDKIPIVRVLEGLGVRHIFETDAYDQARLKELVEKSFETNEFSVVIARHPCMLKFTREQRRKGGYVRRRVSLDQEKCRKIYDCVSAFACPTFQIRENGQVEVNPDLCIGDGSCIQTCPAGALGPGQTGGN